MKQLFILAFSILFISCSGSDDSTESNDTGEELLEEPDMNDFIVDDMINCESADSVLQSYIRIRKMVVDEDEEFDVTGKVFYDQDGLWIINIDEQWNYHSYFTCLVFGASNDLIDAWNVSDGVEEDMADFASSRITENFSLFQGNFYDPEIPDINGKKTAVLDATIWYRTDYSGSSCLYLIDGKRLEKTQVVANSQCLVGECEEIDGYQETIKAGDGPGEVIVVHEENHQGECLVQLAIHYSKLWNGYDQIMNESLPRYFVTDYVEDPFYKDIPRKLWQLSVQSQDTLVDVESIEIKERTRSGEPQYASLIELGMHDWYETLIVGLSFISGSEEFELISRNSGMLWNGGENNLVMDQLQSAEMSMEYNKLHFKVSKNDPEVFIRTRGGSKTLWTSNPNKFPEVEWEEEW